MKQQIQFSSRRKKLQSCLWNEQGTPSPEVLTVNKNQKWSIWWNWSWTYSVSRQFAQEEAWSCLTPSQKKAHTCTIIMHTGSEDTTTNASLCLQHCYELVLGTCIVRNLPSFYCLAFRLMINCVKQGKMHCHCKCLLIVCILGCKGLILTWFVFLSFCDNGQRMNVESQVPGHRLQQQHRESPVWVCIIDNSADLSSLKAIATHKALSVEHRCRQIHWKKEIQELGSKLHLQVWMQQYCFPSFIARYVEWLGGSQ